MMMRPDHGAVDHLKFVGRDPRVVQSAECPPTAPPRSSDRTGSRPTSTCRTLAEGPATALAFRRSRKSRPEQDDDWLACAHSDAGQHGWSPRRRSTHRRISDCVRTELEGAAILSTRPNGNETAVSRPCLKATPRNGWADPRSLPRIPEIRRRTAVPPDQQAL